MTLDPGNPKWIQKLAEALLEIEWNSCIRWRIENVDCIESEIVKKCGFCILKEKGIL